MPLHADIMVRARSLRTRRTYPDSLVQNRQRRHGGQRETATGFYGKPYQPGAIIKNDAKYIFFLRKGGEYRSPSSIQKALSMLIKGGNEIMAPLGLG